MLTDRGWAMTGAGVALAALWVLLGEIELLGAGVLMLVCVALAMATTASGMPRVGITRKLSPSLVHEGETIRVDVIVANQRTRALRNITLVDDVERLGQAAFEIGRLPGREPARAAYQVVCRPRGVYRVGPARLRSGDAFGLTATATDIELTDTLVVYPETEELSGFPTTRGRDPSTHASRPEFSHQGGEDFFTLREYRTGDDLRFVHWPSSARRDELVIKQLETPWQARALVMMDLRREAYENAACFEKAVKGTASVVRHLARSGFDADLWAGGTGTIRVADYARTMEALARVQLASQLDLRAVAGRLSAVGRGGALILVSGVPDHHLLDIHRLFGRDFGTTVVMLASETTSANEAAFHRVNATTVSVDPDSSWAVAWSRAMDRTWERSSPA